MVNIDENDEAAVQKEINQIIEPVIGTHYNIPIYTVPYLIIHTCKTLQYHFYAVVSAYVNYYVILYVILVVYCL